MTSAIRIGSVVGAVMLGGALLAPATVGAQALTKDECKCQQAAAGAQGKFIAAKAKCISKCEAGARKGSNPASDCSEPFAGATAECVNKAESKAQLLETKKCAKDCPECYAGGNCTADAATRTAQSEAAVDALAPIIYCNDAASGDGLNSDEAKCQDATAKESSKFAAAKGKCYAKCRSAECAGKIPAGSCVAPAPSDPTGKTQACIAKAEAKCGGNIDKKCFDDPECYGTTTGAQRCATIESAVDAFVNGFYCASPNGAFVD